MLLTHLICRGVLQDSDKTALVYGNRKTSYAQLHHDVSCFANALLNSEVQQGDRVAILGVNSCHAITAFFGAMWAGAIPLFTNNRWSVDELVDAFDDCEVHALILDGHFGHLVELLAERCGSLNTFVYMGRKEEPKCPERCLSMQAIIDEHTGTEDQCADSSATAFLNYTGGTTGVPKGVMHSHREFMTAMLACKAEGFFGSGAALLVVPLFHISGMICMMSSLFLGDTLVIVDGFNPATLADDIRNQSINQLFMVPTMLRMMLDHPDFHADKLSSVKHIRYGGSPMDLKLLQELTTILPEIDFMQVYGQTEGLPITFLQPEDHRSERADISILASAGQACLGVDIRILDRHGNSVSGNQLGEVAIRGPGMMRGYWNNPELTGETLKNGWLMTGDIGYLDDNGYLFLVERAKDMIITGGENVYSAEVEKAVLAHDMVVACAVVGMPDVKWGESVHAEIVLSAPQEDIESELNQLCHSKIAGYKCPKSYSIVDALPLTAVGKVNKVAIRASYEAQQERYWKTKQKAPN